jgi:cytochrome c biogenesis protein CcdA
MSKKAIFAALLLLVLVLPLTLAQSQCLQDAQKNPTNMYFFYGDGCPHCVAAEPFLAGLEGKYNFTVIRHETWHNSSNQQLFEEFLVAYKVPKSSWGVPGFFMGDRYIIGFDNADSIGKNVEEMVNQCLDNNCGPAGRVIRFSLFGKNFEISKDSSILLLGVILGFADGFNPCTFAILIFLMSYLFTLSASKKKILKLGLIFTFVIFVIYVLIMLGLINLLSFTSFKGTGKIIISIILIVMAGINIKDFFFKGKGPSLEIPKFARPILEKYAKKATVPAIIILAVLLSFVEVLCTLGLPLAYIGIMAERGFSNITEFFYILWYNIFYILPLLIVMFLIYFFVLEADKAEEYRQRLRKYMKLLGGLLMLALAILLLLGML